MFLFDPNIKWDPQNIFFKIISNTFLKIYQNGEKFDLKCKFCLTPPLPKIKLDLQKNSKIVFSQIISKQMLCNAKRIYNILPKSTILAPNLQDFVRRKCNLQAQAFLGLPYILQVSCPPPLKSIQN